MNKICIIPARGGSRRIPRKNIRLFHGKTIMAYPIETARETNIFDRIVVSTEDKDIATIARQLGVDVLERPLELAENDIGTQEVMQHAVTALELDEWDMVCCLYATTPLITRDDLVWAYNINMVRGSGFTVAINTKPLGDAGAFYFGAAYSFAHWRSLYSIHTSIYPLPPERCCDINTEEDWAKAEQMYLSLMENKDGKTLQ